MAKFQKGNRARVKQGYAPKGCEGEIIQAEEGSKGYVAIEDDNTSHRLAFHPDELAESETIPSSVLR